MDRHGFEDYDFVNRLEMVGVRRVLIEKPEYLRYIPHDRSQRYLLPTENLEHLFVNYRTHYESEVLFLYQDGGFEKGLVTDNFSKNADQLIYAYTPCAEHFEFSVQHPGWQTGSWNNEGDRIELAHPDGSKQTLQYSGTGKAVLCLAGLKQQVFYELTDKDVIDEILTFKHFTYTRILMENNLRNQTPVVNQDFGKAVVYKNFQPEPISI